MWRATIQRQNRPGNHRCGKKRKVQLSTRNLADTLKRRNAADRRNAHLGAQKEDNCSGRGQPSVDSKKGPRRTFLGRSKAVGPEKPGEFPVGVEDSAGGADVYRVLDEFKRRDEGIAEDIQRYRR